MAKVAFGRWNPDLPDTDQIGANEAKNVIPVGIRQTRAGDEVIYAPLNDLGTIHAPALPGRALGALSARDRDGNNITVAATATHLYRLAGQTWKALNETPFRSDRSWELSLIGSNIIANNSVDAIQVVGFADRYARPLITSPLKPRARTAAVVAPAFLLIGNLIERADQHPQRVRWSARDWLNWFENYDPEAIYPESGRADLIGPGGPITKIVGGPEAIIFQERAIFVGQYVGGDLLWQFSEVERNRGTKVPNSVVRVGDLTYYLAEDGWYVFAGGQSRPIGAGRINDWFRETFDDQYGHHVSHAIDVDRNLIYWAFPSGANGGVCDRLLIYNWALDCWSQGELTLDQLMRFRQSGWIWEQLDQFGTIEQVPHPLDDPYWQGPDRDMLAALTTLGVEGFDGEPLPAILDSTEVELAPEQYSFVSNSRPLFERHSMLAGDLTVSVQIGTRNSQNDAPTWGQPVALNRYGECPVRAHGRYHRLRLSTVGDFRTLRGFDVTASAEGQY